MSKEKTKKQKTSEEAVEEVVDEVVETTKEETTVTEKEPNEADLLKEKLLRTVAEFDNYKKRTQKEKEALYDFAKCDVLEKIIPILDTLTLSLNHEKDETPFKDGVKLVIKQFNDILKDLGVKEAGIVGETFDPNIHNAVMHIEDENYGENEIVEVLQQGYMINEKVLRYAMVKVAN